MKSQLQCSFEPVFASGSEEDEKILQELSYFAGEIVKEHFDSIIGAAQNDYMIDKFQSADAIRTQIKEGYEYYLVRAEGQMVGFLPWSGICRNEKASCISVNIMYINAFAEMAMHPGSLILCAYRLKLMEIKGCIFM